MARTVTPEQETAPPTPAVNPEALPGADREPTNRELLQIVAQAMQALVARGATAENDTAKQIVAELQAQNQRAVRPSNATHPDISAFNPRGERDHPKTKLKRRVFFNGHLEEYEQLTEPEIQAYNMLSDMLPHADARRTARDGNWEARVSRNGDSLLLKVPCQAIEDLANMPPALVFIVQELADGRAVDPASLLQEVYALREAVAALQLQQARA